MKLTFGKNKISREEIEREAAQELQALIDSGEQPPAIDWSVYSLPPDVADPTQVPAPTSPEPARPASPATRPAPKRPRPAATKRTKASTKRPTTKPAAKRAPRTRKTTT